MAATPAEPGPNTQAGYAGSAWKGR